MGIAQLIANIKFVKKDKKLLGVQEKCLVHICISND